MKNIIWTAQITKAPTVVRYCKKCGDKTDFAAGGQFRINAQQKNLDVWLIYKCTHCSATWNMTVLSRVRPGDIPADLLRGFHENSPELALRYATDATLIRQNGAVPGAPEVEISGEQVSVAVPTRLTLVATQPSEVRAASLIRAKLGLSRAQFDTMCDSGYIRCTSGQNLKKCKLAGELVIEIG